MGRDYFFHMCKVVINHTNILQVLVQHTQTLGLHIDPSNGVNRELHHSKLLCHMDTTATKYLYHT